MDGSLFCFMIFLYIKKFKKMFTNLINGDIIKMPSKNEYRF